VALPGAPRLALEEVEAKQDQQGWKITGRLTQQAPYYNLKVPLRLETDGSKVEAKISLTGGEAPFTLRSNTPPLRLVVDPDVDLFRRLDPAEIPPTVNGIKGSKSLVAVVARSLPAKIQEASATLLEALGQKQAPMLAEDDTPPSRLRGHDVLYLGVPEGEAYLPPLPKGLAISPGDFTLEGVTYDAPEDVLFIVLPHPEGGQRVAGLFLPLSAKAVARAARKIPHYGKYSYLVFRKGVNQVKGTWPVLASPLIHVFTLKEISS
jgi:hypothetical protein